MGHLGAPLKLLITGLPHPRLGPRWLSFSVSGRLELSPGPWLPLAYPLLPCWLWALAPHFLSLLFLPSTDFPAGSHSPPW